MALWVRKLGLIAGLALIIFACEDPGEIGLDLNPEQGVFVAHYKEVPLKTSIVNYEDILSDNNTRISKVNQQFLAGGNLLTGNVDIPEVGKTEAKAFMSIYPWNFKTDSIYIFDSLVMHLHITYMYGKNLSGTKKIYVHELSEELLLDTVYLTKNSTAYFPDPIGEFNVDLSEYDSAGIDTVYTARLSDEFGLKLTGEVTSDSTVFQDNLKFREFFKGLALVSDPANDVILGSFIKTSGQTTYLRLYYHTVKDTTYMDFIIPGTDTAGINITRFYNNITLDKTGTPLEGIPDYYVDFETQNEFTYHHNAGGIFTKLNLGVFNQFKDTIEHMVINRAELIIPVEEYEDYLTPTSFIDLYLMDENNKFREEYDSLNQNIKYLTIGRIKFQKDSLTNAGEFVGDVTTYIQNIASGLNTDTLLYVGLPNLWYSVAAVNQFKSRKDKIRLQIYYSVLKK